MAHTYFVYSILFFCCLLACGLRENICRILFYFAVMFWQNPGTTTSKYIFLIHAYKHCFAIMQTGSNQEKDVHG